MHVNNVQQRNVVGAAVIKASAGWMTEMDRWKHSAEAHLHVVSSACVITHSTNTHIHKSTLLSSPVSILLLFSFLLCPDRQEETWGPCNVSYNHHQWTHTHTHAWKSNTLKVCGIHSFFVLSWKIPADWTMSLDTKDLISNDCQWRLLNCLHLQASCVSLRGVN